MFKLLSCTCDVGEEIFGVNAETSIGIFNTKLALFTSYIVAQLP